MRSDHLGTISTRYWGLEKQRRVNFQVPLHRRNFRRYLIVVVDNFQRTRNPHLSCLVRRRSSYRSCTRLACMRQYLDKPSKRPCERVKKRYQHLLPIMMYLQRIMFKFWGLVTVDARTANHDCLRRLPQSAGLRMLARRLLCGVTDHRLCNLQFELLEEK